MPPPTRANNAMDEAPIANPAMISLNARQASFWNGAPSHARITRPMPSKPRLATARPITAPPENAARSARAWPPARAASAVRTLARVAAFMPKSPARTEQIAPPA